MSTDIDQRSGATVPGEVQKDRAEDGARHIPALDGVRGIAVLMVLFGHFTPRNSAGNSLFFRFFQELLHNGWMGVDLFFVLSGFLITGILLRARPSPRYFRSFYARRVLRIFPIYYLVLTALAVVYWLYPKSRDLQHVLAHWPWCWFYATNYLVALRGSWDAVTTNNLDLGYLWSLAVEEHFYLFWPAVVLICSDRVLVRVCLSIMVLALALRWYAAWVGHDLVYLYVATHCRMDSLAVGALLAVLLRSSSPGNLLYGYRWVAGASAVGIVLVVALQHENLRKFLTIVEYSIIAVAFASFICLSLAGGVVGQLVSSRPLTFFGVYSYGLYIYHGLFAERLSEIFSARRLSFGTGHIWLGILPHYAVCIGIPLLVAILSYELIEKRFLKLKRFFP
jgi:peptidoglycan/LPS O-acetylase OafA/YrhL